MFCCRERFFVSVRIWRPRLLVWTKEKLYIARPVCEEITDTIPLHEIHSVMTMDDESAQQEKIPAPHTGSKANVLVNSNTENSEDPDSSDNPPDRIPPLANEIRSARSLSQTRSIRFLSQARLSNVFHIKTDEFGINAGRTYYISTRCNMDADKCMETITAQLSTLAKTARRKAEAKSRFQRSQEVVKAVQSSAAFQIIMAVLIMLVIARYRHNAILWGFSSAFSSTRRPRQCDP